MNLYVFETNDVHCLSCTGFGVSGYTAVFRRRKYVVDFLRSQGMSAVFYESKWQVFGNLKGYVVAINCVHDGVRTIISHVFARLWVGDG